MAVEARHLFPPQLVGFREMMNSFEANGNIYNTAIGVPPFSGTTETLLPIYGSTIIDSVLAMKALPVSRKRSRDLIAPLLSFPNDQNQNHNNFCASFAFLGEDISSQIQQQQIEIDFFIAQHTEKVRLELENRRKGNFNRIIVAVEEGIKKRLIAKEEEIDKIGKLNCALEERVKYLCIENQIWRDLAQTNESTANALRCNLEQVLAHVQDDGVAATSPLTDDAQSCCGSNYAGDDDDGERSPLAENGERKMENDSMNRWCRNCGKVESCVLLLPCRHLCLCTVCGSSLHTCPICKSIKNASVHVNMSS